MSVGFIMLCHTALDRAEQVARFWAEAGAPVVIHVDARVPAAAFAAFRDALAGLPVSFCRRRRCTWGTWSLVAAAQDAAGQLLERPDVSHVFLASGACLPLRPVAQLEAYLAARLGTDFIESVTCADADWAVGGLGMERFTLRFPFSWKAQRWLFDTWVALQRRYRLNRRIPGGLEPHLGSQWWCLTRETLSAILDDPRRAEFDRYFRHVWIPDESYFQTLCRHHSKRIHSRSLTFSRFNEHGRPQLFFDDHEAVLRDSGCFVARKAWPQAGGLYQAFLSPTAERDVAAPRPAVLEQMFDAADRLRRKGRAGLVMQSRFPRMDHENGKTRGRYTIFHGFTDLFADFEGWLARHVVGPVHGHLFASERAEFAAGATMTTGCLSDAASLRNQNPHAFLRNLMWNAQGVEQCLMASPRDLPAIDWFVAADPNARIAMITGAWAVTLFRAGAPASVIRQEASRLQRVEQKQLEILRSPHIRARVRIWSLAEFMADPSQVFDLVEQIGERPSDLPGVVDIAGFPAFLRDLRDAGLQLREMGNFPVAEESGLCRNG